MVCIELMVTDVVFELVKRVNFADLVKSAMLNVYLAVWEMSNEVS